MEGPSRPPPPKAQATPGVAFLVGVGCPLWPWCYSGGRTTPITGRQLGRPPTRQWARCGHRAPLSEAREIGVRFNHEPPTGCAEVLSINGSVGAHGGSAFKNHEALSAAYRHTR